MSKSYPNWLFLVLTITASGCAGYQTGNRSLFRPDIRTVHVPVFESDSYRPFLGQRLTESVVKQIELDSPLNIAGPANADSFLIGKIVADRKIARTLDQFGDVRVPVTEWRVEVNWIDRAGTPLMQRQTLTITDGVDFIPEGGQSLSTAQRELIGRIARQIVGQMEIPW